MENNHKKNKILIIGAGPAGLAAGYKLVKEGYRVTILEREKQVGGICRTIEHKGYHYDFGGHRFFTKVDEVQQFWHEILGEDFLERSRLSRMYYKKKFFAYPIKLGDALPKLGIWESFLCFLSLLKVKIKRLFKKSEEKSFEDWVINRFGRRLFEHFFKSYTEKVWGVSTRELGADWAAQRLKDISLIKVIKSFVIKPKHGEVKSWIDKFHYPKYGPGMLYEKVADYISEYGGKIIFGAKAKKIVYKNGWVQKVIANINGEKIDYQADNYISTMAMNELLKAFDPEVDKNIKEILKNLKFRSFLEVCLVVDKKDVFPDNWIYVHEPEVKLLRVQNFKNWSESMSPDQNKTPIGAEYVCWYGDELWNKSEDELVKFATEELTKIGLLNTEDVEEGIVIRSRYVYPVYHLNYQEDLSHVWQFTDSLKNFQTIGRAGLFRYNNMDHSILTGFYAARNIMGAHLNIRSINADKDYHEEEQSK